MVPTLDYLLQRQISPQWRGLLTALAEEFAAHPLPPCDSTADLADALNARWQEADWGYVELVDEADYLRIAHCCAPLQAFGSAALAWTPAFLEGVYQTWLRALGADGLSVAQASEFDEYATIEFRLGRQPA
jgi:hypothetical protein